jgi:ribonuclease T
MPSILDDLDRFISLDIESAGPVPSQYALLSIGACTVARPQRTFYAELVPDRDHFDPQAMAVHGLDLARLRAEGLPPARALENLADWLAEVVPAGRGPLMVGFNAPFDWMFINDYFIRYLGHNPFGHSTIDIKAVYLGASGSSWAETTGSRLQRRYLDGRELTHNALDDALVQAHIFQGILKEFFAPA